MYPCSVFSKSPVNMLSYFHNLKNFKKGKRESHSCLILTRDGRGSAADKGLSIFRGLQGTTFIQEQIWLIRRSRPEVRTVVS